MKKLALINLMLLTVIKSVSAFSESVDKNFANPFKDNFFYQGIYFYSLVFLIAANFGLYFVRGKKDYLSLAILIIIVVLMIFITLGVQFATDGSRDFTAFLKWEFMFFLTISTLHLCLWISKKSLPNVRIEKGDMISLKLK